VSGRPGRSPDGLRRWPSRGLIDVFYGSDGSDGFFRFLSLKCEQPIDLHSPAVSLPIIKKRMSRPSRPSCPKLNNGRGFL